MDNKRTIWVDFDNAPHVAFLLPLARELESRGFYLFYTARNHAETTILLKSQGVKFLSIGGEFAKSKIAKVFGTLHRALQLQKRIGSQKIFGFLSHGSRAGVLASFFKGIPSVTLYDYEYVDTTIFNIFSTKVLVPNVITDRDIVQAGINPKNIAKYPGLKEELYLPGFIPSAELFHLLGLNPEKIIVTVRPPATFGHYHNQESENILSALFDYLLGFPEIELVVLPRRKEQKIQIQDMYFHGKQKVVIPETAVDGLNLIWNSDLVISGGGTMIREAAALGVPAYSIFTGKVGAVDRCLEQQKKISFIRTLSDIKSIVIRKRSKITVDKIQLQEKSNMLVQYIINQALKVFR